MKKKFLVLAFAMMIGMTGCSGEDKKESENTKVTESDNTEKDKEGEIIFTEYTGKKMSDVFADGYELHGYSNLFGRIVFGLSKDDFSHPDLDEFLQKIEGKTVAQMRDEYDMKISWNGGQGDYEFSTWLGMLKITFDIENGAATLDKQEDRSSFELEEAAEIQNDVLKNVTFDSVTISVNLDKESEKLLNKLESDEDPEGEHLMGSDHIENNPDDFVIEKMYISTK